MHDSVNERYHREGKGFGTALFILGLGIIATYYGTSSIRYLGIFLIIITIIGLFNFFRKNNEHRNKYGYD